MSAIDQHDFVNPARMAELEARVQWLETTLERVLGERSARCAPDAHGQINTHIRADTSKDTTNAHANTVAQDSAGVSAAEFDLWMLRTQLMPTISVPVSLSGQNSVVEIDLALCKTRKMPQADASTVIDIDPTLFKTPKLPRAQDSATSPDPALHAPQVTIAQRLDRTQPLSAIEQIAPPAVVESMGFTAAFSTLDAKVTEAAASECMIPPVYLSGAPVLHLDPALLDDAPPRGAQESASAGPAAMRNQPSALEQHYPSILQKITGLWCSGEARNYLKKLVDDDRGARHGFDPAAMMELRMLTSILAQHEREAGFGTMPVAA